MSPLHRDPRAFGRKPAPPVHRVPCAILAGGMACLVAMIGLTFTDAKPAAPFLVGLLGFVLILTAILSLTED